MSAQAKLTHKCLTVGPAECRTPAPLTVLGQVVLPKLIREDCDGQVSVFHTTVPPMSGPPLHRHSRKTNGSMFWTGKSRSR
jgi:hypothetical protein